MQNIYNNSHTSNAAILIPNNLLREPSKETPSGNATITTSIQGVMCNHFSFPLLYHTNTLLPFTCKLFHNNTLIESLPLPNDDSSYPLSLIYLRYYLNHNLSLGASRRIIPYPTPSSINYLTYSGDVWSFNNDDPKTASPLVIFGKTMFLTICTHLSCIGFSSSNPNPTGFLLQSPSPSHLSQCSDESIQLWIGGSEKCLTLHHSLPDDSLAPFFVLFPPSTTNNHIYFLESSLTPSSIFQFTIDTEITVEGKYITRDVPSTFLIKGLAQPSPIVNNCHIHDLHNIFPNVLSQILVVNIDSMKALLSEDTKVTFHTPTNSYGLVEGNDAAGQRSISLAPLQTLVNETVALKGIYDSRDWLAMMESLKKIGMEVTQIHPPPPTEKQQSSAAEYATEKDNPEREFNTTELLDTPGGALISAGTDQLQGVDQLLLNEKSEEGKPTGREEGERVKSPNQLSGVHDSSVVSLFESAIKKKKSDIEQKSLDGNQGGKGVPSSLRDNDQNAGFGQFGGPQHNSDGMGLATGGGYVGHSSLQKENGTEKGNTSGKGLLDGMTPYVVGAVLVVALILFFLFRQRVRRGRKEKEESSRSEELLQTCAV